MPLCIAGLRLFGPIGALGGFVCAEESCRLIVLRRAGQLFDSGVLRCLPRELWVQAGAALLAALPGAVALSLASGPLLAQLFICGAVFAVAYLVTVRLFQEGRCESPISTTATRAA